MRPKIATYSPSKAYRYAHLKRDGIWITLQRPLVGRVQALSRIEHDLIGQLETNLTVHAFQNRATPGTSLYCELYAPGQQASQVKSLLADGRAEELRIDCFASPDLPEDASLADVTVYASRLGVSTAPWAPYDWPDWRSQPDAEGLVYKDGNLLNWARHKDVLTCDLVCLGFTEGKLANLGYIGAIELGLADGTHVCNCGGMTHAERVDMTENEDQYIGQVCEIRYQRVESRGGLRHPRFVRWRDDKLPSECERP